jgi:multidrug efflux pump
MHVKYHALLIKVIGLKKYLIYVLLALVVVGGVVSFFIRQELLPLEDRGYLFIPTISPDGSNFEYTKKYVDEVEKILSVNKNVNTYASFIMEPTSSFTFVDLKDWNKRSVSQMEIADSLNKRIFSIPGVMAFAINPPSIDTRHDAPVLLVLKGYADYRQLDQISQDIMTKMRQYPEFVNVDKDIKLNNPAIKINLNRDKVAFYNVDTAQIARIIQENFVNITIKNGFRMNNESYSVEIGLADKDKTDASAFEKLYVASKDGTMIPLLSLIDYEYTTQPKSLNHYNKLRSVTITSNLNWGVGLGSVVPILEKIAQETITGNDMVYEFAGEIKDMQKSSSELYIIFVLAILFIYFILAAQFESFLDSAIILCSVPFAIVGALLTLFLIGGSLNIYSKIGLITLVGLITKNAILIVEFTNQKLKQGLDLEKAVIEASSTRLRPIMMTTLAMIVGAIPLAFATGPGAISRNEIGWVIVGGLSIGTFFTLFVIPIICIVVKGYKLKIMGK